MTCSCLIEQEAGGEFYRKNGYDEATINAVLDAMFKVDIINRIFYDDYVRAFAGHYVLENAELMTNDVPQDLLDILRKKYPGRLDFSTYGGKYHFRCPG